MNKNIRLLVEGFFDDEIFDVKNDIKTDLEDLGRYYDYQVGDFYYQNKKPYAICCGDKSLFKDNKSRFCLLNISSEELQWRIRNTEVQELQYFEYKSFNLNSFKTFKHIDENGYRNTLIIKNNYKYKLFEFPAFKYCINLGDNVYLPAIDELLMMYLNKDKLGKYSFSSGLKGYYWSSTLYSGSYACCTSRMGYVDYFSKIRKYWVYPFYNID